MPAKKSTKKATKATTTETTTFGYIKVIRATENHADALSKAGFDVEKIEHDGEEFLKVGINGWIDEPVLITSGDAGQDALKAFAKRCVDEKLMIEYRHVVAVSANGSVVNGANACRYFGPASCFIATKEPRSKKKGKKKNGGGNATLDDLLS
jgi:hypothetical protein